MAERLATRNHLAWFVIEAVEHLDIDSLSATDRKSEGGELAYPPRVMLVLLIYAYSTGTFASRRIAAQVEDSIAFRVIAAGLQPGHRTISRFRDEHLDEFHRLFVQVVQLAQEAGPVKMGTVAIDGSKVKANASKHKAMSYDRMLVEKSKLRSEIHKLTQAARDQDRIDDDFFGTTVAATVRTSLTTPVLLCKRWSALHRTGWPADQQPWPGSTP